MGDVFEMIAEGAPLPLLIVLLPLILWYESAQCGAHWKFSGLRTTWGPVQGCLVETSPGIWMPEKSVRDIDIKRSK